MNQPIDILIPWVDDKDLHWVEQRNFYADRCNQESSEQSNIRFQSWDNLHLWFRAIDECMPWVHKIILVTCGQVPSFLQTDHPKLAIVNHEDYIPSEYLPTFNSNSIEMNAHRIKELSENFILFNDDVFPLLFIEEEYYFKDNMICDEAVENIISTGAFTSGLKWMRYAQVNNMFIINKHFKKEEVQGKNWDKWYCDDYGDRLERTKACRYWYDFPGLYDPHMPNAMKKSTLAYLWDVEYEALDKGARNRFRSYSDVTQYLIRYWQICTGDFIPRRTEGKVFFPTIDTYRDVVTAIREKMYPMISINENCTSEEFKVMKDGINEALEEIFPVKSSFEK